MDDPKFGYASCPRCGGGNLARTETPVKTRRTGDGGLIRTRSQIVLCRSCGDVVYEKEQAERVGEAKPAATEQREESAPDALDRFKKIELD